MEDLGYADGYKYAHDYPGHFVEQQFLPDEIQGTSIWKPQENPSENKLLERLKMLWKGRF
jgi:putative ATPase